MIKDILQIDAPHSTNPGGHICWEWNDTLSEILNIPIRHTYLSTQVQAKIFIAERFPFVKKIYDFVKRSVKRMLGKNTGKNSTPVNNPIEQDLNAPLSICILMWADGQYGFIAGQNTIPICIDLVDQHLPQLVYKTSKMKLFYVTSREVYDRVRRLAPNSNVHYMPLSVPDKYYSPNFEAYRSKSIDVIQFGRCNDVLHEYMLRYSKEHPNVEYVHSENLRKFGSKYVSTVRGDIGVFSERSQFIELLSHAKVSLVSSSGPDGIHFPSPRFYESAILGCALLGRYPDNQEFTELNMRRYCPNITSYEQFCEELERALAQTPEELYAQNREFILNSLTSKRAQQIQRDLASLS